MAFLNYHHLRYFRAIAHEGSLTKAARHLKLSQSALSVQLRSLEDSLGQPLFERKHKALVLTEAGQIALEYADSIFRSGEELTDLLQNRGKRSRGFLRVGAASLVRASGTGSGWSQRWDSNPRPPDYKSGALPIELRWRRATWPTGSPKRGHPQSGRTRALSSARTAK